MKSILLCVPLLMLCCACERHSKEDMAPLTEEHANDFAKSTPAPAKPAETPSK